MSLDVELAARLGELLPERRALIFEMVKALHTPIKMWVNTGSDIMAGGFAESFADRLRLYHVTHVENLNKKAFEHAFRAASRAVGRSAELDEDPTNPGADINVDGVAFSLKTEASRELCTTKITISKLMEARWIRECRTGEDFRSNIISKVIPHLQKYERILVLRAQSAEPGKITYSLVEIPTALLLKMDTLKASDFSARTENGSSSAKVRDGDTTLFLLRLDGSVEKITISNLETKYCQLHGYWIIPVDAK